MKNKNKDKEPEVGDIGRVGSVGEVERVKIGIAKGPSIFVTYTKNK